ncbi:MAG: Asp-tRNA(Asn)/Glu-tRNA(Gln) amidotransferase subunit GatB [Myxococcaceae bacterium]|nr:Asp-tRNA(Asn)/Glu-tRNA(Gln) amidotransferase subunit GatB [Myxococcaceae bacterium]
MSVADFQAVIGLEVHAQLLTATKIFCGCATAFGAEPNAYTCPVCLGMPGALPVLNEKVVEFAVRTGLALGCEIRETSVWARKNYFYPDLPKGYQISQYDLPICEHGRITIDTPEGEKTIRVRRIHMEEDAGKNVHDAAAGLTRVDLNRAGVPLLEIVSEPDLRTAEEAAEYLKQLRDILVYLGVNDGNLEEGSFRCDANVSVMRRGTSDFGTRTELKNLNSFRFIRQAIDYEIARQVEVIESGGAVVQETRLYDPDRGETRPMRSKEEAHDYRYFPDPDLPPLRLSRAFIEQVRSTLPELPRAKQARFVAELALPAYDARVLTADRALAEYFEACVSVYAGDRKKLANWFMGEVARLMNERGVSVSDVREKIPPAHFAALLGEIDKGAISNNAAKEVFSEMFRTGREPLGIISEKGLAQISDLGAIEQAVDEILAKNADSVASYRAGNQKLLGFFVGQVMKAMKGKGNPQRVNEVLRKKLGGQG